MKNLQSLISRFSLIAFLALSVAALFGASARGATYYVSLTGNDRWLGTSPEYAWRHIAYAGVQARAGDTVYIAAGDYGHEHVVVSHSGTSSAPIVFEGYNGRPILNGNDRTGQGILISGKNYITFKNIQLSMYMDCIFGLSARYITLENIVIGACGGLNCDGCGIRLELSQQSTVRNCEVTDAGGVGILIWKSDSCMIDNCRVYGTLLYGNPNYQYAMDYYIDVGWGIGNTIQNCYASDTVASNKGNHGIGVKDGNPGGSHPNSYNNKIINCTALNFEECYYVAHGAHHNEFINCDGDNTAKGTAFNNVFMVRDSASVNTFTNCRGVGNKQVVCVYFWEDYWDGSIDQIQANNSFINCIFKNGIVGAFLRDAQFTTFRNCTFSNSTNLFRFGKGGAGVDLNSNTTIKNCIIADVDFQYDTRTLQQPYSLTSTPETGYSDMHDVTTTYTDFWSSFSALPGTGNISQDPLFADTAAGDYHLKSMTGWWTPHGWVVDRVHSPCIDAGDPADPWQNERLPNGSRINMGAYGNTAQASMSGPMSQWPNWGDPLGVPPAPLVRPGIPAQFALHPPHPNPFNPTTVASYELRAASHVSLRVYDTAGRLAMTLVDGWREAGSHEVIFDGTDLPSGVYLCRLQAGAFEAVQKMVLLK